MYTDRGATLLQATILATGNIPVLAFAAMWMQQTTQFAP